MSDLILADYWERARSQRALCRCASRRPENSFTLSAVAGLGFFAENWPANPPAIGDFNGDGLLDVAWSSANYISDSMATPVPTTRYFSAMAKGTLFQAARGSRLRAAILPRGTSTPAAPRIWRPSTALASRSSLARAMELSHPPKTTESATIRCSCCRLI